MKTQAFTHQRVLALVERFLGREYQCCRTDSRCFGQRMQPQRFLLGTDAGPKLRLARCPATSQSIPTAAKFDLWASTAAQKSRRVRDAADQGIRPNGLPVIAHFHRKVEETKFGQKLPSAQSSCGELLHALRDCSFQVFASAGKSAAGSAVSRNSAASAPGGKSRLKAGDNFAGLADTLTECHREANQARGLPLLCCMDDNERREQTTARQGLAMMADTARLCAVRSHEFSVGIHCAIGRTGHGPVSRSHRVRGAR